MIRGLIFDIDGTLLDSFEANLFYFRELFTRAGYSPPTKEEFKSLFHKPTREIIPIVTGVTDEKEINRIWDLTRDPSVRGMRAKLIDGAVETFKILKQKYWDVPLNSVDSQ